MPMKPSARLQAAIDILSALEKTDQPADRLIRDYFRSRRYAGSKDRAAVAEQVFSVLRHRFSLAWAIEDETPRALVLACVVLGGGDPDTLFTGEAYAPAPLTEDEERRRKALRNDPPLYAEGGFPQFLEPELTRAFGDKVLREMAALQTRAPVDLRVNTLRRERGEVLAALVAQGFAAEATRFAPHGIRIASGEASSSLGRGAMFESGAFEFQDEAAQIAATLCRARPGMRILDLAAGAGGKTLALAAQMRNQGEIVACDIRQPALQALAARAARAGATNIKTHLLDDGAPLEGKFDAVLLDAPCASTGTFRRHPDVLWATRPGDIAKLAETQRRLLAAAARRVRPGGRLVYCVCSLEPEEGEGQIEPFLAAHPDFRLDPALPGEGGAPEASLTPVGTLRILPGHREGGTDGFFAARFVREEPRLAGTRADG